LLNKELADAAPRACVWLDSGEAIARRVASLLIAPQGAAKVRRAGFTDAGVIDALRPALSARGFSTFAQIGVSPAFDAVPLVGTASA
jgi:glutamate racemase